MMRSERWAYHGEIAFHRQLHAWGASPIHIGPTPVWRPIAVLDRCYSRQAKITKFDVAIFIDLQGTVAGLSV